MNYYHADDGKELPTQAAFARTDEVAQIEKSLINTIKGLSTLVDQPWHLVIEFFVPINCDSIFHWYSKFFEQKVITDWAALESYKEKIESDQFQVEHVSGIAQQDSGCLDCGVFVAVFAEYLSDEFDTPSSNIDAQYHHLRYATLLCKQGSQKAKNGYFSENDDPRKLKSSFIPTEKNRVLNVE
ncbi:hypothetical protein T459_04489 [Capsicum annuum]|uniref:Ubiquitin-like protease family profile domain-containing protein n=1 Tax=Capsicum annuum TaxID=4072 RepID=A0A2G3A555_CAPAN|nr:hypothetical protein T459_04489 [Capsicum annuum]